MVHASLRRLGACLGALVVLALPVPGAGACRDLLGEVALAQARNDLDRLSELHGQAQRAEAGCSGDQRAALGERVALTYALAAQTELPDRIAAAAALVRLGLKHGRPWKVVALAADLAHEQGQFSRAARLYQEAVNTLGDDTLGDDRRITAAEVRTHLPALRKRVDQSRALAATYVAPLPTRSGSPGGAWHPGARGVRLEYVVLPIRFVFDQTTFTELGRRYAEELLAFLTETAAADAVLIGHTDPRGGDCYNIDLARRRAAAVETYLTDHGYQGAVTTVTRGERDPYPIDDPGAYTLDQQHQIHRRVELWLAPGPAPHEAVCR